MTYNYTQPSLNVCNPFVNPALTACGNTHLGNQFVGPQFSTLEEQRNYFRRPRPSSVVINTGDGRVAEQLNTHAFFAQDQWTHKRLTLSGALRYDHATSRYDSTCVDADVFVPAALAYCTGEHDGVSFNDCRRAGAPSTTCSAMEKRPSNSITASTWDRRRSAASTPRPTRRGER